MHVHTHTYVGKVNISRLFDLEEDYTDLWRSLKYIDI